MKPKWQTEDWFRPTPGRRYYAMGKYSILCVAVSDDGRKAAFEEDVDTRRVGKRWRFYEWEYSDDQFHLAWCEVGADRGSVLERTRTQ